MIKTQKHDGKKLDQKTLYKDALYLHLVHNGCKEKLAKLKVERMIKQAEYTF